MNRTRWSKKIFSILVAACLVAVTASNTMASGPDPSKPSAPASPLVAGDLDQSFGGFGEKGVVPVLDIASTYADSIAIQPDGKILVLMWVEWDGPIYLLRYHKDGRLDLDFGQSGMVDVMGQASNGAVKVLVQPDGKILVIGTISSNFAALRLHPSGALDNSFGSAGYAYMDFDYHPISRDVALSAALQPDGKIVIVGRVIDESGYDGFGTARLLPNGDPDLSFSEDGDGKDVVVFDHGHDWGVNFGPSDVAIGQNGKIVVAGHVECCSSSGNFDFALLRYMSNGVLDDSFDEDGLMSHYGDGNDFLSAIALQGDGKIVAVGTSGPDDGFYPVVVRYLNDGARDPNFGDSGFVRLPSDGIVARDIAVHGDGKLWISLAGGNVMLKRLNSSGTPDNSFSPQAFFVHNGDDLLLQPDGKVLLLAMDQDDFHYLVRYNPDGSLDTPGKVQTAFSPWPDRAFDLAIQPDGKILLAGDSHTNGVPGLDIALARYNQNGSPDYGFGQGGQVLAGHTTYEFGKSVAVMSSGKIVVGGYVQAPDGDDFLTYGFNQDGSQYNALYKTLDFGVGHDRVVKVLLQQIDGQEKIVLVGSTEITSWGRDGIGLARYNENGDLDTSFGGHGTGTNVTGIGGFASILVRSAVIQPDGKILVAGGYFGQFLVARYKANGAMDTSFGGGDGIVMVGGGGDDTANAVAVFPGGRIVLAGKAGRDVGNQYPSDDFGLAFLNTDGSVCTTCGNFVGNLVRTDFGGDEEVRAVVIQPDNKILVTGQKVAHDPTGSAYYLARYRYKLFPTNERGYVLDTSLDDNGMLEFYITWLNKAWALALDEQYRILVAGYSFNGNDYDFSMARLLNDVAPPSDKIVFLPLVVR